MTTIAPPQMMIVSAERYISREVPGRYPSMADQTNYQRQKKQQHAPWIEAGGMARDKTKPPKAVPFGSRRKVELHPVEHTPYICPHIIFYICVPG
jgi:hypothetical protein